jgi:hypothetical protein
MKKGPQTIEKAKQGAYVARTVSSLQKIRLRDGVLGGVVHRVGRYALPQTLRTAHGGSDRFG